METPESASKSDQNGSNAGVPYVALGDSLTHGMQSLGVAWISQHCSYPKVIAEFLGITTFKQPTLYGGEPGKEEDDNGKHWIGCPPNLELVARAAAKLAQANGGATAGTIKTSIRSSIATQGTDMSAAVRAAVNAYMRSVEDANPLDLVAERAEDGLYQNLGVHGFLVDDIRNTRYSGAQPAVAALDAIRAEAALSARRSLEWVSDRWDALTGVHRSLPVALSLAALAWAQGDLSERITTAKLLQVLGASGGPEEGTGRTAFEAMALQRPHLVTLLIGANNMMGAMLQARLWDDNHQPLYTQPLDFERQLAHLVDEILTVESHPFLFLGTLPSPTASPNLLRDRLGHWKPIAPSSAYLTDDQILELEEVIAAYNDAITRIATQRAGRVWLVDIFALHARILRATRQDAEIVRRGVEHAVRVNVLTQQQAEAVVRAARAGNLDTIAHLRALHQRLVGREFYGVQTLSATESGADLASPLYMQPPNPHLPPTKKQLNAFVVRLKPKRLQPSGAVANQGSQPDPIYRYYRLTGEYLAADQDGVITQGGAVGLDALHMTNTGYAYMAREFLRVIYQANVDMKGAVLKGLVGADKTFEQFDDEFDQKLQHIAEEDTLLNDVPALGPAALDLLNIVSSGLGETHYWDPVG